MVAMVHEALAVYMTVDANLKPRLSWREPFLFPQILKVELRGPSGLPIPQRIAWPCDSMTVVMGLLRATRIATAG
jgi:hypothetical protein